MALVTARGSSVVSAQDKYTVKVPGGLAFSKFRGYEGWKLISISDNGTLIAADPGKYRDHPSEVRVYLAKPQTAAQEHVTSDPDGA